MIDLTAPDFTEARYRALLDSARKRFRFVKFSDDLTASDIVLWRHDIDFSPQRALALAQIEADLGVTASYFVLLGSPFYNPFETPVREVFREIANLGHDVGLHYDAEAVDGDGEAHLDRIAFEAAALSRHLGVKIDSISIHNPTVSPQAVFDQPRCAGFINASAPRLRNQFTYVSDSNGRWRFRSLDSVIGDKNTTRLYALTHAEWWTPAPMTRSARVARCIEGRAKRVAADYEALLMRYRPEALRNE